jgi:hypothetical protein
VPKENAIIGRVVRLESPEPSEARDRAETRVLIEGEREIRLDLEDKRSPGFAEILAQLQERRLPVYLEVDPETSRLQRLLIPHVDRVKAVRHIDHDVWGIELENSHARHVLRRESPYYEEIEPQLREALATRQPLILTVDDALEIIDARFYKPHPEDPPLPFPKPPWPLEPRPWLWPFRWLRPILRWPIWPWWWMWWLRCLSPERAQEVFDEMRGRSCEPLTVPAPCIPFLYPDDGCWGRAHEMCRLMIENGLSPRKVWIQGQLHVATRNNPNCGVWWGWHVAPTLCVRGTFPRRQAMVIDPSLFDGPVTKAEWKSVQGDPAAVLTDTDASDFLWGTTDPTYTETNRVLAEYRLRLQARALQVGPPPYANCP